MAHYTQIIAIFVNIKAGDNSCVVHIEVFYGNLQIYKL